MEDPELVVLLDEGGSPVGTSPKISVHTDATPLHLAFSCYLTDQDGRLLVTRRALSKPTWPGVWTNSFCGHPAPGETLEQAVRRRGREELRTVVGAVEERLPDFRYRAVDAGGVVENEVCPVFTARASGPVAPDAAEVVEWVWVDPEALLRSVESVPFAFSPWLRAQLPRLFTAGAFAAGSDG
ncbi:isopentenyl-diphosphate Delta-isomerase [Leucobacter sp. CSA1]|uniref:Isopentenyl-diphosphate Delta-isomerase n=1 Tax=Leucobacter chromiisoli TaxID=2796471 RepID=A0A934Q8V2_9MICO|nr:isopentenyl-diphosphate Delta-isomerase [Leucobacter chromiisoli]MBK0419425.1 isopentenyl-diphosphate Delta-isomerase [Leucobacter chromiisoli]